MTNHVSIIPEEEIAERQALCRKALQITNPGAGGLMAFNRVSIYYLTGTMANGVLWLPHDGEAVLMVRKGLERSLAESPYTRVAEYRSFADLEGVCRENNSPLKRVIAAEQSGLVWNLAQNLMRNLPNHCFQNSNNLIPMLRSKKTAWELERMRKAGAGHAAAMETVLPERLRPGMTEMEVAKLVFDVYYELGSCGMSRLSNLADELVTGFVSVGENCNFPSFYNGPLGCRGIHPAAPFWGSPHKTWSPESILVVDMGFCHEGYNSDKTLCYFSGKAEAIPAVVRRAYQVCKDIEEECSAALRPGAIPAQLYGQALERADKAGFAGQFMGLGRNQVPFLGHGIGLYVDEWPVIAHRFDDPLEENMTMAIEPKIAFPEHGMVGTENTWEITPAGGRCLTGGIRDIVCIE